MYPFLAQKETDRVLLRPKCPDWKRERAYGI